MWYLKEKLNDEIYFYHVEKHRKFLQVNITILDVHIQTSSKYPK